VSLDASGVSFFVNIYTAIGCFLFFIGFAFIVRVYFIVNKNRHPIKKDKRGIALGTISLIWKKQSEHLKLIELVNLWKNNADDEVVEKLNIPEFTHPEIDAFFNLHIHHEQLFVFPVKQFIINLLDLLDKKGDVPSVVKLSGDPNRLFSSQVFEILAKIPLYRHTLNVVNEVMATQKKGFIYTKLFVAALAHDIGKIDGHVLKSKSLGYKKHDHPAISANMLVGIDGFSKLSFGQEIVMAVRGHHKPIETADSLLSVSLQTVDRSTRQKELENAGYVEQDDVKVKNKEDEHKKILAAMASDLTPSTFSAWFDSESLLFEIGKKINVIENGQWEVFSSKDGIVYCQAKSVWDILELLAKNAKVQFIAAAAQDKNIKRKIILHIVETLQEEGNLASHLIKEGYFGAPFIVNMRGGRKINAIYVPMPIESFAKYGTLSVFEARKTGILEQIESVEPDFQKKVM